LQSGFAVAQRKLPTHQVRDVGRGKAVFVNLSPQRYLQYREEGTADARQRSVFIDHVLAGGVKPWVRVTDDAGRRPRNVEVTYWSKGDRTLLFVVQNAVVTGSAFGGGGAQGLIDRKTRVHVEFPGNVNDVVNERTGQRLGDGSRFSADFNSVEAVFLSFQGSPPRGS
jgi:hypothetical protein